MAYGILQHKNLGFIEHLVTLVQSFLGFGIGTLVEGVFPGSGHGPTISLLSLQLTNQNANASDAKTVYWKHTFEHQTHEAYLQDSFKATCNVHLGSLGSNLKLQTLKHNNTALTPERTYVPVITSPVKPPAGWPRTRRCRADNAHDPVSSSPQRAALRRFFVRGSQRRHAISSRSRRSSSGTGSNSEIPQ